MKEQLHTIQLTRRELGLVHHIMSIKYTDIDDNVKFGNTSRNQFWQDEYGKDAITGVYLKTRDEIYAHYDTSSWVCKDYNEKTHLLNLSAITRSMRTITKITWRLLNS